jgi:hypothetical protein
MRIYEGIAARLYEHHDRNGVVVRRVYEGPDFAVATTIGWTSSVNDAQTLPATVG